LAQDWTALRSTDDRRHGRFATDSPANSAILRLTPVAKSGRFFGCSPDSDGGIEEVRATLHLAGMAGRRSAHKSGVVAHLRLYSCDGWAGQSSFSFFRVRNRIISAKEPKKLPVVSRWRRIVPLPAGGLPVDCVTGRLWTTADGAGCGCAKRWAALKCWRTSRAVAWFIGSSTARACPRERAGGRQGTLNVHGLSPQLLRTFGALTAESGQGRACLAVPRPSGDRTFDNRDVGRRPAGGRARRGRIWQAGKPFTRCGHRAYAPRTCSKTAPISPSSRACSPLAGWRRRRS